MNDNINNNEDNRDEDDESEGEADEDEEDDERGDEADDAAEVGERGPLAVVRLREGRGRPGRGLMLFGMYLILFVTQGIALVALTLFGLADTALDRRRPKGDPAP